MAAERFSSVAAAVGADDRLGTLERLVVVLTDAIAEVDDPQVPPLAARLVDVLRRIGGDDLSVLFDLRTQLARSVDRLAAVQGMHEDGKPLGTALAPMVRQLVDVIDALDAAAGAMPDEESPLDEISAARERRRSDREAAASGL